MEKRFVYLFLLKNSGDKNDEKIKQHINYWANNNLDGYLGGLFADKSGGLITFEAGDMDEAARYIENDPIRKEDLIGEKWLKEWELE